MTNVFEDGVNQSNQDPDIDGLTASVTELNILDGATLNTTELNYVKNVTSAIQTQLNSKSPKCIIGFGSVTQVLNDTGGNRFLGLIGQPTAQVTESNVQMILGIAGTLKNASVRVTANTNTSTSAWTLRKGGVSTALVISVTASTTGIFSDNTNSVSIISTDLLCWLLPTSTVGTTSAPGIVVEFDAI